MAKVLVLELDPVFAAVIEDRLIVSGHAPVWVQDPAVAFSSATEGLADLLIMELELPGVSGIEIVRQLRQQSETRSIPIVALSAKYESSDRIAALQAGVDDFLAKPCDPEELALRVDRLLGKGVGTAPQVLRGDLTSHPSWELLQVIEHSAKSGVLMIHGKKGSGRITFDRGVVLQASWQRLRGREALLALVEMKEGKFQQTTEAAGTGPLPAASLSIQEVLIQAAWIEDELTKRRNHLPATGAGLEVITGLPTVEESFGFLPIESIYKQVHKQRGVRLYELMTEGSHAPGKVRLAAAWLAEKGVLIPQEQPIETSQMSTAEISSSVVIDVAVHNLLSAARGVGFDVSALPYLLLAEPGAWPELQQLPARVPGFFNIEALRKLVERTQDGHGGSATFAADFGKLSLHVQPLAGTQQVEAIVPVCAGVLLWMDQAKDKDLLRRVVDRLEAARGHAVGIIIATTPTAGTVAAELTADTTKWKTSSHAPKSLIGVLRLLQPRAS